MLLAHEAKMCGAADRTVSAGPWWSGVTTETHVKYCKVVLRHRVDGDDGATTGQLNLLLGSGNSLALGTVRAAAGPSAGRGGGKR